MTLLRHTLPTALAATALLLAGCARQGGTEPGTDLSAQALAAAEASGFHPPDGGDGGTLHIYTWCDYIAPEILQGFEKGLGVTVVIDTFDSNEAMYAKLKAGGTGYDLITPTSYQIAAMAKEGMIDALDHARIPNVRANFAPSFAGQILDPSFEYNVPYVVTYTGFAYVKDKIPEGADPASWAILGNPALRGRISLLDDIREVIGAGLMYLGYSMNSTDPAEIDAAVEQILQWRVNVRKFDGESYKTEVPSGATWLGHGYSSDTTQVIVGDEESGVPPRDDIGFALPAEGYCIAFDELVVASNASRKDLAYAFINYLYDPEVAAANMNYVCGLSPVAGGIELLDPDYRELIVLDEATLANGQVIKGFEDQPEVMDLYNKAWDRIKASQ
ncbi:MAG: polyamine ABC transporter substrate-binding protein [Kiritimatiellia bacterium]|jgi:spermidine/putrescine transport system substrate-binding protein